MPLRGVLVRLRRLAAGPPFHSVAPDLDWADLLGEPDLLRRSLRRAVREDPGRELDSALDECWALIAGEACQESLYSSQAIAHARQPEGVSPVAPRLYRNAAWLVATAGAASAMRRSGDPAGAWSALTRWWRGGIVRFGGAVGQPPAMPREWWGGALAAAARCFADAGWDTALPAFWTAWWLGESGRLSQSAVPLAGCYAGVGFLADLALTSIAPRGGFVIEHPDGALHPLGESLMEAVRLAAAPVRKGIAWRIAPRVEFPGGALPLDGDSLGAAAAAGFGLFDADLAYDPRCLLLAAVAPGGALRPVGGEVEKLKLAKAQGFQKAGVAFDSDLSDEDLTRLGPVHTRRLRSVREAMNFARLTQAAPPWL